jgi:hypothetical protein
VSEKRRIPWYYWPWWMILLGAALFIFYVLFTPFWMGIRFISWVADRFGGGRELAASAGPNRNASASE